jgi:hypothetical protein
MKHIPFPCEPVELTEFELDAVAGGNPFAINISALGSSVSLITRYRQSPRHHHYNHRRQQRPH